MPGPPPKRSSQRRRRNKDSRPVDRSVSDGVQRAPKLTGRHSAIGRRFYESLGRSGQARYFEPSDWAAAELLVLAIDQFVKSPSASLLQSIEHGMTNLLVTEGDRRRVRLELERPDEGAEPGDDPSVAELDDYRSRLRLA